VADTEKITVNLSVVDLGKIDLLVDQGVYSNRTDLIRTAIRNQLDKHTSIVEQTITRKMLAVGVVKLSRRGLEASQAKGEQLDVRVVGLLVVAKDVSPELVRETIRSIELFGVLQASAEVKEVLQERNV